MLGRKGRTALVGLPVAVVALVVAGSATGCRRDGASQAAATPSQGRAVYLAQGCVACHGASRQGSATAPPLSGLKAHWTAQALKAYLRDPLVQRAGDERLEQLAARYPADMPPVQVADEALDALVRYLLESR